MHRKDALRFRCVHPSTRLRVLRAGDLDRSATPGSTGPVTTEPHPRGFRLFTFQRAAPVSRDDSPIATFVTTVVVFPNWGRRILSCVSAVSTPRERQIQRRPREIINPFPTATYTPVRRRSLSTGGQKTAEAIDTASRQASDEVVRGFSRQLQLPKQLTGRARGRLRNLFKYLMRPATVRQGAEILSFFPIVPTVTAARSAAHAGRSSPWAGPRPASGTALPAR